MNSKRKSRSRQLRRGVSSWLGFERVGNKARFIKGVERNLGCQGEDFLHSCLGTEELVKNLEQGSPRLPPGSKRLAL